MPRRAEPPRTIRPTPEAVSPTLRLTIHSAAVRALSRIINNLPSIEVTDRPDLDVIASAIAVAQCTDPARAKRHRIIHRIAADVAALTRGSVPIIAAVADRAIDDAAETVVREHAHLLGTSPENGLRLVKISRNAADARRTAYAGTPR